MPDDATFRKILEEARADVASAGDDPAALAGLRTKYLGRKGSLSEAMRAIADASDKAAYGAAGNAAKRELEALLGGGEQSGGKLPPVDITMPGTQVPTGHLHPLTQVLREIREIFTGLGFSVADGPEVEDDWHNFEALNMGPDHPARDMQDTFYVEGSQDKTGAYRLLPRTHTSGVQIRAMKDSEPPIRIIAPGRVYRNEAEDATHSAVFPQVEGLMVDETTSFADLKGILEEMVRQLLGQDAKLRFRPSFFPYTEPSAEIDVSMPHVRGGQWLELGGSGMVHPNVLKAAGWDAKKYRGFAFGLGPARIAMLKYGIQDLRLFLKPDVRLLEQF